MVDHIARRGNDIFGRLLVSALMMAAASTLFFVLGGYALAARLLRQSFSDFLHRNSYALAPMMIIGSLSHVGTFFFVHYATDLGNAWYWLMGAEQTMRPLATMRDGWVHLFTNKD